MSTGVVAPQRLKRAGELLHSAWGALYLSETYGAALLVEEMELACDFLSRLKSGKGREDGLDALTRSMVQLPIYIESLLGGGRDIALVLLPMLNDLRAARGEPLLSEGTLLLLNLSPSRSKEKKERQGSGEDPVLVARRLRPKYQLAHCSAGSRAATASDILKRWRRLQPRWSTRRRETTCTSSGGLPGACSSRCKMAGSKHRSR